MHLTDKLCNGGRKCTRSGVVYNMTYAAPQLMGLCAKNNLPSKEGNTVLPEPSAASQYAQLHPCQASQPQSGS